MTLTKIKYSIIAFFMVAFNVLLYMVYTGFGKNNNIKEKIDKQKEKIDGRKKTYNNWLDNHPPAKSI